MNTAKPTRSSEPAGRRPDAGPGPAPSVEPPAAEPLASEPLASEPLAAERPAGGKRRWYEDGSDPDYRFSLANERTFLAWIRTALALIAAAVALKQLVPPFRIPGVRTGLSVLLAALGLAITVTAYRHWVACELAMRRRQTLPRSRLMPWLTGVLAGVGSVVAVVVLLETR